MLKLTHFLILIVLLTGSVSVISAQTPENTDIAYLFVNLTSTPAVDLYLDEAVVFYGMETTQLSAERFLLNPGTFTYKIYAANDQDTPLAELSAEFTGGEQILLVAYDTEAGIQLATFERDLRPIPANLSRLQVVQIGETLPALSLIAQNGDQLVEALAFGDSFNAEIPGGNYEVNIDAATGENIGAFGINLPSGSQTLVVIYGEDRAQTLQLNSSLAQEGFFRFVHAGRISPKLDVYFDERLVLVEVGYGDAVDYRALPAGDYTVAIYEAGATFGDDDPLWSGAVSLSTNFPLTGVAVGETNFRMLTYVDDLQQVPLNSHRMRFIHAALNMPLLTVTDGADQVIVGGVDYALASSNLNETSAPRTLIFKETDGANFVTLENFGFQPNRVYTFIVMGNALVNNGVQVLPLEWTWKQE